MELSCSLKSMQEQQKSLHVSCSSKHNFAFLVYRHCPMVRNTNLDNSKSGHLSGLENNLSFQTLRDVIHYPTCSTTYNRKIRKQLDCK